MVTIRSRNNFKVNTVIFTNFLKNQVKLTPSIETQNFLFLSRIFWNCTLPNKQFRTEGTWFTYLDFVSCSSSGTSIFTVLKTVSPKVVEPRSRIWDNPILEESRGLYSLTRTLVTISGCGRLRRTKVSPLVDNGGQTGTRPELLSRDTSTATADGQAEKNLTFGMQ